MPTAVECIRAKQTSPISYPLYAILRFDFPARGNMPPVSVYWYDTARTGNPADYYHPKGLENEVLLPEENNLVARGRPDIGSNRGWSGRHYRTEGLGGPTSPLGGPPRAASGDTGAPKGVLLEDGSIFVGDKGYLATVGRGEGVQLLPAARWAEYRLPAPVLSRSPGHYRDWIRACKGGEPACSNFAVAGPYAEWVTLGAIAYRFQGKLEYDAKLRRFTNNPEANQYLKPAFRKGWELKL